MNFYYWLIDLLTAGWFARKFGHLYGLRRARLEAYQVSVAPLNAGESPLWFHGASVGELEMIAPILDRALELGIPCSVSAFSDSALPWLLRLQQHPHAQNLRYLGLTPRERDWAPLWERLGVRGVWLAKYDFWPGMWHAASKLGVEVRIVNARARESWKHLARVMDLLHIPAPRLSFFATTEVHASHVRAQFPDAEVRLAPDPRRYRIRARAARQTPEARAVIARLQSLPRPLGIVGSAWASDLERIASLTDVTIRGSIAVFPHSFEPEALERTRAALTAVARAHPVQTILIEQKGVLVECYAAADWVWVGGGFGAGIHSTLEPAYFRKPLIAGPKNAHKFDEIPELENANVLTLVETPEQMSQWFKARQDGPPPGMLDVPFADRAQFEAWADPLLAPFRNPR